MSLIVEFLKQEIEDLRPDYTFGSDNPNFNFASLTLVEYSTFRERIFYKYKKIVRVKHMFICTCFVELAEIIEMLPEQNVLNNVGE